MNKISENRRIIEIVIVVLLLLLLLFSLFTILTPFLGVFTYTLILAVPLYNTFEWFVKKIGNRRKIAGVIYVILALAILVVPFSFMISAVAEKVQDAFDWFGMVKAEGVPPLPEWLREIPIVGKKINELWKALEGNSSDVFTKYEKQIGIVASTVFTVGTGLVRSVIELVLAILLSAIILTKGIILMKPVRTLLSKLLGEENSQSIIQATGWAIKGVTFGALGTAIICAFFAWVGYAIVGISFAVLLAAATFILVLIQVGPIWVLIPSVFYVASQGNMGNTIFIAIYGIVVLLGIDNILKPYLIGKNGKMPILVLFLGVVGGMFAWGFTGIFKGAVILAVFYTIITTYLNLDRGVKKKGESDAAS
ncbi:MAG TPA: AI-2E family transporter [Chitinophagales bacterium]|nr:AI-2E family transporter [Chitinophagales bacterium]